MEENQTYFFAICTWPNSRVRAKQISRFQFEGKNDVWMSQVRRVNVQKVGHKWLNVQGTGQGMEACA